MPEDKQIINQIINIDAAEELVRGGGGQNDDAL